ncbi:hypothetical protein CYMTET_3647 [Cymbomonas tetramitiformis]|uniref:Uncharacterized protein n=1 Tax=Cymbomonas tetramitiformis TaxID=36881 RepID=A0AAE0H2T9_9CHLO|nr:hypothetical protein CYMTET_3647 [Cymbomonas tetramitiformis]
MASSPIAFENVSPSSPVPEKPPEASTPPSSKQDVPTSPVLQPSPVAVDDLVQEPVAVPTRNSVNPPFVNPCAGRGVSPRKAIPISRGISKGMGKGRGIPPGNTMGRSPRYAAKLAIRAQQAKARRAQKAQAKAAAPPNTDPTAQATPISTHSQQTTSDHTPVRQIVFNEVANASKPADGTPESAEGETVKRAHPITNEIGGENSDDDMDTSFPPTWCFICKKDHPTRQPVTSVTEKIRLASIFVRPSLRTTIDRLFDRHSMGILDDPNIRNVWDVLAEEFNSSIVRVSLCEPMDSSFDEIHFAAYNPNLLLHTRPSAWLKSIYDDIRPLLTVLNSNYNISGQNEPERWRYMNSLKGKACDVGVYYWWMVMEQAGFTSRVVKGLDPKVAGESSISGAEHGKKTIHATAATDHASSVDQALEKTCEQQTAVLALQRAREEHELREAQARTATEAHREKTFLLSKQQDNVKLAQTLVSDPDMDPEIKTKARSKILEWLDSW